MILDTSQHLLDALIASLHKTLLHIYQVFMLTVEVMLVSEYRPFPGAAGLGEV